MSEIQKEYNEIYIPNLDVLNLSGRSVFENISSKRGQKKKNLAVLPISFIEKLENSKKAYIGLGGEDVLKYLREFPTPLRIDSSKYSMNLYNASDALNIGILLNDDSLNNIDQYISGLGLQSSSEKPIILTNESTAHLKYKSSTLDVQIPKFLMVSQDIVNEGIIDGNMELWAEIQQNQGSLDLEKVLDILGIESMYRNQFIRLYDPNNPKKEQFLKITSDLEYNLSKTRIIGEKNKRAVQLNHGNFKDFSIFGINPKDLEQYIALKHGIIDPDISLMFIAGSQGSGKTLLSYIGAINQIVYDNNKVPPYRQMILLKPNEIIGGSRRDMGFLPGSLYDKLKPHLAPYEDAHNESDLAQCAFEDLLKHPKHDTDFGPKRSLHKVANVTLPDTNAAIEIVFSGFLRGRSFRDSIVLVDEAQNFTPYEVKTILQRLGEGCKAIVMGDPYQTDNPYCSREINGLTHAINHYLGRPYVGLVKLSRNYRSQMSKEADGWQVYGTQ